MKLKDKVKYVRIKLQLTQVELAQKTGISAITIARWETDEDCNPQPKLLGKFLAFCEENHIDFDSMEVK